jgi:hypothetical protein
VQGQKACAVIAVNDEEAQATVDGILTLGTYGCIIAASMQAAGDSSRGCG